MSTFSRSLLAHNLCFLCHWRPLCLLGCDLNKNVGVHCNVDRVILSKDLGILFCSEHFSQGTFFNTCSLSFFSFFCTLHLPLPSPPPSPSYLFFLSSCSSSSSSPPEIQTQRLIPHCLREPREQDLLCWDRAHQLAARLQCPQLQPHTQHSRSPNTTPPSAHST